MMLTGNCEIIEKKYPPGGRKRPWIIQMIVPTHLKSGFGKRGPEFFATGPSDDASDIDS